MTLVIHVDGGSRGNPGPAAVGVTIRDQDTGRVLHEAGYFLGRTTNNVAEYRGLLKALEIARTILAASSAPSEGAVQIRSDSQLMVRQVLGEYRVKSADLQPLYAEVMQTLADLDATYGSGRPRGAWRIEHVRREHNARADELVNQCLDMGEDVIVADALSAEGTAKPIKKTPHTPGQDWLEVVATSGFTKSTCPAYAPDGQRWILASAAPQGLCLHALTAAILAGWCPASGEKAAEPTGQTPCQRCGRTVRWGRSSG